MPISTAEQSTFRLRCRTDQSGDSGAGEVLSLAADLVGWETLYEVLGDRKSADGHLDSAGSGCRGSLPIWR